MDSEVESTTSGLDKTLERVFAFCYHTKSWQPKVMLVPYSVLVEEADKQHHQEILNEMEVLKKSGPIIKEKYEPRKDENGKVTGASLIGYITSDGILKQDSAEMDLIGKWCHYSEDFSYDEDLYPEWYRRCYFFPVQGNNQFLSPQDLYDNVKTMTMWKSGTIEVPIQVEDCVMVTEMREEHQSKVKTMRFFYSVPAEETPLDPNLEENMKKTFDLLSVSLSNGYGFVFFRKEVDLDDYKMKTFFLHGVKIIFDDA